MMNTLSTVQEIEQHARDIVAKLQLNERLNFQLMLQGSRGGRYPLMCMVAIEPLFQRSDWQPNALGLAVEAVLAEGTVDR